MMRTAFLSVVILATSALCAANAGESALAAIPTTPDLLKIEIRRHSAWSSVPPKGVDADGMRMNLAPRDSLEFRDIVLTVTEMMASQSADTPDTVTLDLKRGQITETRTLAEGAAFNWNGYHIAIVAIYGKPGELGLGSTVIEVATVDSLPKEVAESAKANGPEFRLRVKHDINKLTLHHSATKHAPGDDLATKLQNQQKWGETDRNWFNVPYHFFVDLDGSVFEARNYKYMGDTNTRYDPRGHFLINCFGNYSEAEPNEQQLLTIAKLMAWAAAEFKIDPLEIYGHRDLAQTSCPGDNLYRYVQDGTLRKMVEAIQKVGKPEIVWLEDKGAKPKPQP